MNKEKVIIGTWGMGGDFGNEVNIEEIIKKALESGFDQFDTAMVYGGGKVEEVLGAFKGGNLKIATKIPAIKKPDLMKTNEDIREYYPQQYIREKIRDCLKRYTSQKVQTVQLHNWHGSFEVDYIRQELQPYKNDGHFQRIGVSLPENFTGDIPNAFDSVQLPYNVINVPLPLQVSDYTGEVWVRSVFYHGLILKDRSHKFLANDQRAKKANDDFWEKLEEFKRKKGISTQDLLIKSIIEDIESKNPHKVIIGVSNPTQIGVNF
jgi:aryl-alcohol dehydrogenase-like predicted oxidoreductase